MRAPAECWHSRNQPYGRGERFARLTTYPVLCRTAAQSLDVWHREQAEVAPRLPRLLGPKTMRQRPLGVGDLDGGAVLFEPDSDNLHVCRRPVNHVDEGLRVDVAYFHGGVGAHLDALPALVQRKRAFRDSADDSELEEVACERPNVHRGEQGILKQELEDLARRRM